MLIKKNIFESIIAGAVSSLITIGFQIFGPIIFLLSYFTPLPFFFISLKYKFSNLIISILTSITILILFSSVLTSILFFIINITPAILLSIEIRKKENFSYGDIITRITLLNSIIFILISFLYSESLSNFSIEFNNQIQSLVKSNIYIEQNIINLIPSLIISSWTIILIVNLIIAKNIFLKFINKTVYKDKIINMKIPKWLSILFLSCLIPSVILDNKAIQILNSLIIIYSVPITLQGFIVVQKIIHSFQIKNFILYSFYGIIFIFPIGIALITALGVLDTFYNFKNLNLNKKNLE